MLIGVLKSKIHCVTVTQAELDYVGSITIDEELMEAAGLFENEQVHVLNKRNGERIITYVIKGERGTGIICLNGPAALKFQVGDVVIIISYTWLSIDEAKNFKPTIIFPDTKTNRLIK
ncbi:MAG: aspartate 1-decarboxylase [Acidobacteria bacterium]|nr:MAG: aspartate 1-decarboxylase [Acidobacteriota bacterium]